jgi:hypothetical protein
MNIARIRIRIRNSKTTSHSQKFKLFLLSVICSVSILGCQVTPGGSGSNGSGSTGTTNGNDEDTAYGWVKSFGTSDFADISSVTKPLNDGTFITAGSFEDGTPWIGKMDAEGNLYDQFSLLPPVFNEKLSTKIATDGRQLVLLRSANDVISKVQLQDVSGAVLWTQEYPLETIAGITSDYITYDATDFYSVKSSHTINEVGSTISLVTPIDANGSDGSSFYMVMHRELINERVRGNVTQNGVLQPKIFKENVFWLQRISVQTGEILWRSPLYRSRVGFERSFNKNAKPRLSPSANGDLDWHYVLPYFRVNIEFSDTGGVRIFYKSGDVESNVLYTSTGLVDAADNGAVRYAGFDLSDYKFVNGYRFLLDGNDLSVYDSRLNLINTKNLYLEGYEYAFGAPPRTDVFCGVKNIYSDSDCVYVWVSRKSNAGRGHKLFMFDERGNELLETTIVGTTSVGISSIRPPKCFFGSEVLYPEAGWLTGHNIICAKMTAYSNDPDYYLYSEETDLLSINVISASPRAEGSGYDYRNRFYEHTVVSNIQAKKDANSDDMNMRVDQDGVLYMDSRITEIGNTYNTGIYTILTVNPALANIGVADTAEPLFTEVTGVLGSQLPSNVNQQNQVNNYSDERSLPFTNQLQSSHNRNSFVVSDVTELENGTIIAVLSPGNFSSSKVIVALQGGRILWRKNLYQSISEATLPRGISPESKLAKTDHNNLLKVEARLESLPGNTFSVFLNDGVLLKMDGLTGEKIWERSWLDNSFLSDPLLNNSIYKERIRYKGRVGDYYRLVLNAHRSESGDYVVPLVATADVRGGEGQDLGFSLMKNNDLLVSMPIFQGNAITHDPNDASRRFMSGYDTKLFIARVDQDGNELWKKIFDIKEIDSDMEGAGPTKPNSQIVEMPNGNILVAVKYPSYLQRRVTTIYLLLLNPEGEVILTRKLENTYNTSTGFTASNLRERPGNPDDSPLPVVMDVNKAGQVWLGFTFYPENLASDDDDFASVNTLLLMRLDKNLKPELIRSYGGLGSDEIKDLRVLDDGGVLVTSETNSITASTDAWVLRLGADGLLMNSCAALMNFSDGVEASAAFYSSKILPLLQADTIAANKITFDTTTEVREVHEVTDSRLRIVSSQDKVITSRSCSGPAKKLLESLGVQSVLKITAYVGGRITDDSQPNIIDCEMGASLECQGSYNIDKEIALTAQANTGFVFNGWTGDCADISGTTSSGASINLVMDTDKNCSANFVLGTPAIETSDLTVILSGAGIGRVISATAVIDCGVDCNETLVVGSVIMLTATPDTNSRFTGWSGTGDCSTSVTANQLSINLSQNSECIATFVPTSADVTLTLNIFGGPNAGEINSFETPTPIMHCVNNNEASTTCTATFSVDTSLILNPLSYGLSNSVTWTNCDSVFNGAISPALTGCAAALTEDRTISVRFSQAAEIIDYTITASVVRINGGGGSIASSVSQGVTGYLNCPDCSAVFTASTPSRVVFEARPGVGTAGFGSTFVGWGAGQCDFESFANGYNTCSIDLVPGTPTTRQIEATFSGKSAPPANTFALNVLVNNVAGSTAAGSHVTSVNSVIDCGSICSDTLTSGTSVTLTAVAVGAEVFERWYCLIEDGGTATTNPQRTVVMDGSQACYATFAVPTPVYDLNVSVSTTAGAVVSSKVRTVSFLPSSIDCGSSCSNTGLPENFSVILLAEPAGNEIFQNWSGSCTQGQTAAVIQNPQITFLMSADQNCNAVFAPPTNGYTVSVSMLGAGSGSVRTFVSSSIGNVTAENNIFCNADGSGVCSSVFVPNFQGVSVNLNLYLDAGSTFGAWSGCDSERILPNTQGGQIHICDIDLNANKGISVTIN